MTTDPISDLTSAAALAQAIVVTVRDPLLVLDTDLRVTAAGRSFYQNFRVGANEVMGRSVFELLDRRLDVPNLWPLLTSVVTTHAVFDNFEINGTFSGVGQRTLILNARVVFDGSADVRTILLGFEDITARRKIEHHKEALLEQTAELLAQKDVLLREIQHRVGCRSSLASW